MQCCEFDMEKLMDYRNTSDVGMRVYMLDREGWSICKGENRVKV